MPRRLPVELICAGIAMAAVAVAYALIALGGLPKPSSWVGHGLGIVGFLLMLSTEVLYTLRKRLRRFTLGPTTTWLQIHIFTGIVGPFLVLLHSAGKFNGLAGAVMLLTLLMVLSGFIGRYLYTAAPRTLEGTEVDLAELQRRLQDAERQMQSLSETARAALAVGATMPAAWLAVLARPILLSRYQARLRKAVLQLPLAERIVAQPLIEVFVDRYRLLLQVHSLAATRRLLALWHLLHVPLGGVLFGLAFVHIGAALYYATFMK